MTRPEALIELIAEGPSRQMRVDNMKASLRMLQAVDLDPRVEPLAEIRFDPGADTRREVPP